MTIIVHFDGLCEPVNPGGIGAYGVVIENTANCAKITHNGIVGEGPTISNNVAEYAGLISALESLIKIGVLKEPYAITIFGDSQLVIKQMTREWQAHGGLYLPYKEKADELVKQFHGTIVFRWTPREGNEESDALSKKAYEDYCKTHGKEALYMQSRNIKDPKWRNTDDDLGDMPIPQKAIQRIKEITGGGKAVILTRSTEETRQALESMRKDRPAGDVIVQDELPSIHDESSGKIVDGFKSIIQGGLPYKAFTQFYETTSKTIMREINERETCMNCESMQYRGTHVGCFPKGKYRKFLSKAFVKNNKCDDYKRNTRTKPLPSEQEELDQYITEHLGSTDTDDHVTPRPGDKPNPNFKGT